MFYGPLEAGIGRNVRGWRCRLSSMLNNIGGGRTRTFFKLVERSTSLGVGECVEVICSTIITIAVNASFLLTRYHGGPQRLDRYGSGSTTFCNAYFLYRPRTYFEVSTRYMYIY